ncbi:MAG TPA: MSMEG_4193 family putative phosphomutase [Actinomycetota bacterium]|nr:MSMEG_4193 family putative phosphomutase [Actinomycetota bacterium]
MAVLVLVRHAVTDQTGKRLYGQRPGIHLSARGRDQSEEVARRLSGLPIAAVYSSPLERCVETAEPIAGALGLEVQPDPRLLETDMGAWTGKTFGQVRRARLWSRILAVPSSTRFPDGESLAEVQARAVAAVESIGARHGNGHAVVVSHGDPIRLVLAHYAGLHLDLFQRLEVAPASVSMVATGEHGPRLLRLNDTGSLDLAGPRGGRMRRR